MNFSVTIFNSWTAVKKIWAATLIASTILTLMLPLSQVAYAAAGVPKIINHQGRLMDGSGTLLGGAGTDYCFQFSFYDDVTVGLGTKIWPTGSPSTMTAEVKNGVFNVGIGDTDAGGDVLDFNFEDNDAAYLNVAVASKVGATCAPGDGAESFENLSPRQRIVASGYAVNADTVDGFHAAQNASGDQIPVLTGGNLVLGGTNPYIRATTTNALLFQGGGAAGDIEFFSSGNRLTSGGNLSLLGTMLANAVSSLTTFSVGTTATTTVQGSTTGTSTFQGFVDVLGTNSTSTFSGGLAAANLQLTNALATSTAANGFNITAGCFAVNGSCVGGVNSVVASDGTLTITPTGGNVQASINLGNANLWTGLQQFSRASSTQFSAGRAAFGETATTTIDTAGNVVVAGTLNATG